MTADVLPMGQKAATANVQLVKLALDPEEGMGSVSEDGENLKSIQRTLIHNICGFVHPSTYAKYKMSGISGDRQLTDPWIASGEEDDTILFESPVAGFVAVTGVDYSNSLANGGGGIVLKLLVPFGRYLPEGDEGVALLIGEGVTFSAMSE